MLIKLNIIYASNSSLDSLPYDLCVEYRREWTTPNHLDNLSLPHSN